MSVSSYSLFFDYMFWATVTTNKGSYKLNNDFFYFFLSKCKTKLYGIDMFTLDSSISTSFIGLLDKWKSIWDLTFFSNNYFRFTAGICPISLTSLAFFNGSLTWSISTLRYALSFDFKKIILTNPCLWRKAT
jgi:hypothetical protein